ncbi:PEP-CTERM sorting domain-containing protein [Myxococcota bacterium]|nr:PEP-CTERM sorting domain-containing protein [Myxococcota bacterium]
MFRSLLSFVVALGLFLATAAEAVVSFNVIGTSTSSGASLNDVGIGDEVTIDIRMSNPTGASIYAVGAGIQGWDNNIAQLVSAQMAPGPFFCTTPVCTNGLFNSLSFPQAPNTDTYLAGPGDVQNFPGVGSYLPLVQAVTINPRAGDGSRDPGLDGVVGGGDAQFRIMFRILQPGLVTLNIGTNPSPTLGNVVVIGNGAGGILEVQAINASLVFPIPEPGTALLIGLGLAGLAGTRRRD